MKITLPASGIDQVYAYPPSLKTENAGDTYIITGSLAADEILAIEMLGLPGASAVPGFRNPVSDVRGKTASAAFWYNLPYYGASILNILGKIAVILVPLILILMYRRTGRRRHLSSRPTSAQSPARTSSPGR